MKNALIILFFSLSTSVSATTYYIDPSGSNSNNGSNTSPWKTLAYACSKAASSGDIIHVNAGTYTETTQCSLAVGVNIEGEGVTSIIKSHVSTASKFTIQLSSSQGTNGNQHISGIKLDGDALTGYGGIQISGRSNVVINDVTFVDFKYGAISILSGVGWGVQPTTYATNNQIYNCDIDNCSGYYDSNGYGQIDFYGTSGLLIHDNNLNQTTRTGANGYLIKAVGGFNKGTKIYNNYFVKTEDYVNFQILMEFWNSEGGMEIYNNEIYGGYIDCAGDYSVKGSYSYSFDIHNNTFGLFALGPSELWTEGISCEGDQSDIIIRNNNFTNFDFPVLLTQNGTSTIQRIYIYYNIFKTIAASGSSGYAGVGMYNTNATAVNDNIFILNNDFYNGTTPSSASGVQIWTAGTNSNIYIENNIFQGLSYASVWLRSGSFDYLTIQNNIAYGNGNSNNPVSNVTPTHYTYVDAIKSNPLFVSSSDFHLQSTSPAINAGIHITNPTILTDYDGVKIGNPPEIGAYESGSASSTPVVPVYQSSSVENATPTIIVMSYDSSLVNIVPAASAFNVQVNSAARTVSSVAIVGGKVQLTLASAIVYGDIITVAYTKPSSNPLQTASGGVAASFSAQSVTNNCVGPPVYVSSVIQNATPTILDMTYSTSLANIVPGTSAFYVLVNSVARTVNSVSIAGTDVRLTLASAVVYGDIITVAYTKPASNPLQTASGVVAASFSAKSVTNNCVSPPVYVSSVIQNATPTILDMTYSTSLANIVPGTSAFYVLVNSVARTVNSVSIGGTDVLLTLASAVVYGDVITVAYTKPVSNPLQTASGGVAASISAKSVTNNCNPPVPVYVSSVVENATPTLLDMTYSIALTNIVPAVSSFSVKVNYVTRTVNSVAIVNGKVRLTLASQIVYGDKVTVAYNAPASNPLQTALGGVAASISAKTVTNNCISNIPVYISSSIEDATPSELEMTYSLSLANIVPAITAFNVLVNSVTRAISSVAIVGSKVILTLSSPVVYGDIVTVSYAIPASNQLQTISGDKAASINNQSVSNNCGVDIPIYISSVVENVAPAILEMNYNLDLANIVPATTAFYVLVNSVARTVDSVSINGGNVQLTLEDPIVFGDIVTVSYTSPESNPLQTSSGGLAENISDQPVTNNIAAAIPNYINSVVENAAPTIIIMSYDSSLANVVPAASAFNVQVNSVVRTVSSVAIVGGKVQLTLSSAVVFGDIVTVDYSRPATNPLQTSSGGLAASFSAKSVTNNCVAPPVYVSSVIGNATPTILDMTYSISLANIVPGTSAFYVLVNSVARTVNSVSIVGTDVRLTLASAVVYGDVVTVAYAKPANNPLQTASGGVAASISAKSVTNNCASPPVYVSSVIQNATPTKLDITYSISLANIVPGTSAFYVLVNSVARTVNSVSIAGTDVLLTLASAVVYGDIITVTYTKPASNPLQTALGGVAVSISAKTVTNNCIAPPVYVSSSVENATPTILNLTYNMNLANIVPVTSAFYVLVNSVARTVNSVSIVGSNVRLTLSSPIVYGDIITVSYTKPANNPLQTASGGVAASISGKSVTNNCVEPPVYVSSAIENATPTILNMTYDMSLANIVPATVAFYVSVNSLARTINSVAIVGGKVQLTLSSPVVFGDIITVTYTKPAYNPLQTTSGGIAASISAKSVTNNCAPPIPVYISSVVENATPTLLDMTYSIALTNIVPAVSSFSVKVNYVTRTVNSVAIVGGKVRLTLVSPIVYGDRITVAYTKPVSNPLQTASGGVAASISAKTVTNNCISNIPVYISSIIENATPSELEMTYSLSLANIVPAITAFNVQVNSVTRAINSVAIVGGKVQLTLSSPVVVGDIVTVSYTVPASNQLQTISGNKAANIYNQSVTNNCGVDIPIYISSVVENVTPTILEMTYNSNLANIVPASTAFYVLVNSVARSVDSVIIKGTKVQLILDDPIVYGDIITVSYTIPSINPLQISSGGLAEDISDQSVTNNCAATIPNYINSVIESATPAILEITYDSDLANIVPDASAFDVEVNSVSRNVNSVAIVGGKVQLTLSSPIVFGDIVTVDYNSPATDPLQTPSGGLAASFWGQSVTNNCAAFIPNYISSIVENDTPAILVMTYSLALANIVPAASAFDVQVNSVSRTINSVAIVGGKVQLTLSSAIVFGDLVTVGYTSPATNPLQTSSGGLAASIIGQSVTNNCAETIPNYINSVVENATPTILDITYDLDLANIVPAASAFDVQVNSVSRTVDSVAIVGDKVRLILSSAVVFGDIVTVNYTIPATNPIQTSSGGLAASISGQSVTNNCQNPSEPNDPPVVVVNDEFEGYSGFVYELDASGSYDLNNDTLIFNWILPDEVSASSTIGSKIQFLAPIVSTALKFEFQLNVTDGKAIVSKTITINILPYKPEVPVAKITNIEASDYQVPDYPKNIADGNLATKWSTKYDGQWIIFGLTKLFKISYLEIAFLQGQKYESFFDIYASADSLKWDPILTNAASCNFSGNFQIFVFPPSNTSTYYKYVKLVGHGTELNSWNNFSEFKIFGSRQITPTSGNNDSMETVIYPNPAKNYFTVSIEEPTVEPDLILIINISGKVVFEEPFNSFIKKIQIPDNLNSGIYIVELKSGAIILDAQKLIINR